jgi:hypothetical protein
MGDAAGATLVAMHLDHYAALTVLLHGPAG